MENGSGAPSGAVSRRGLHHVAPPRFFDVALQFDAQRAVVPEAVDAAVNLARLKQETASFAQRNQLFHLHGLAWFKCEGALHEVRCQGP
jgi:hypothetical protein